LSADVISVDTTFSHPIFEEIAPPELSHHTSQTLGSLPIQVLHVEDDPAYAQLIHALVTESRDSPFQVKWQDNILKAISRLAKPGIDVVLLDLGMKELGGYNTHLAIANVIGKALPPVVILTSDDSAVSRDQAKNLRAAGYLVKHRTSGVEIRQALRDAVVPAMREVTKGPQSVEEQDVSASAAITVSWTATEKSSGSLRPSCTDGLRRSHQELREAVRLAGQQIVKLDRGHGSDAVLEFLRRTLEEARAVAKLLAVIPQGIGSESSTEGKSRFERRV
jgi:DNA-binding NarL/FixJ family response regulator